MDEPKTPEADPLAVFREGLLGLTDFWQAAVDGAAGYRAKCVEAGFSETAAEMMAVDMHRVFVATMFGGSA